MLQSKKVLPFVLGLLIGVLVPSPLQEKRPLPMTAATAQHNAVKSNEEESFWTVQPFEQSALREFAPEQYTDVYNPFYHYLNVFGKNGRPPPKKGIPEREQVPMWDTWFHYPEAYHNHMARFRRRDRVVIMEVGVQSGGKIGLFRDYFGPGLEYVGIDINPSCKMFESAPWVHIEIGDSSSADFWAEIKEKYPVVDIFLDDGGHRMNQQKLALELMLPHVSPDGVYICEDLSTSWGGRFGGVANMDHRHEAFREKTMVGLVHKTLDWLNYGWISGGIMRYDTSLEAGFFAEPWWQVIPQQIKHIHYYNQLVVYEKGRTYTPNHMRTEGMTVPYKSSGTHELVDWNVIMKKIQNTTGSKWNW